MSNKNGIRPSVKLHYRIVLGLPAIIMEVGGREVAFDRIEDVLHRVVRHFEPEQPPAEAPNPKGGRPKKNVQGLTRWVGESLKSPRTTTQVYEEAKVSGFSSTTPGSVYSSLWHLRKRGVVTHDKDTGLWTKKGAK